MSLKTSDGRLREACIVRIHEMRAAYDSEGRARNPAMTYQEIASELQISLTTVYNVVTGRTHRDYVPLGHPKHPQTPKQLP